jgi:hypothetical protein
MNHPPRTRLWSLLLPLALASATFLAATPASAESYVRTRNFGIGFQFGSPTALTFKSFGSYGTAIDGGLGVSGYGGYGRCRDANGNWYYCGAPGVSDISLHLDYLWQRPLARGAVNLDWHYGFGGRAIFFRALDSADRALALIARMPLGIDIGFNGPVEVFAEIDPGIVVVPPIYFALDAAIGVRFFF